HDRIWQRPRVPYCRPDEATSSCGTRNRKGEAASRKRVQLHLPDLARLDVEERRKLFRPLKRFSLGWAFDQEVTADYLLGLQEWTVSDGPASVPRHSHGPRLRTEAS